jgi:ATP-dependent Lhr-like helicase
MRPSPAPTFDRCLDFVATGGYALRAYDQWQRLMQRPDGLWQLRDPRAASRIRMNIGTIVDADTMAVRLEIPRRQAAGRGGGYFASMLRKGDTFLIGGEIVRYEGMREMVVEVTRTPWQKPKIATFMGTKFATSTQLSDRILTMFRQDDWPALPAPHPRLAALQREVSRLPERDRLLVESFPP